MASSCAGPGRDKRWTADFWLLGVQRGVTVLVNVSWGVVLRKALITLWCTLMPRTFSWPQSRSPNQHVELLISKGKFGPRATSRRSKH